MISNARLAEILNASPRHLASLARRADGLHRPVRYTTDRKVRLLLVPTSELKSVQHSLYHNVLKPLPLSEAAHAAPGRGVVTNATAHLGCDWLVLRDIADCFPSVTPQMVSRALMSTGHFEPECALLITRLCTAHNQLPQGAPTSPVILNLVLKQLDETLSATAQARGHVYTRYVDDVAISGVTSIQATVSDATRMIRSAGFRLRKSKSRQWGPKDTKTVTGIALRSTLYPSEEFLLEFEEFIDSASRSELRSNQARLLGKLSWVRQLSPEHATVLEEKIASRSSCQRYR